MLRVPSEIQANQFEFLKLQNTTFVAYRSDVYPSKNDVFFEENAVIYVLEGDKMFSNASTEVKVSKGEVLIIKRGYYLMSESINAEYKSLVFFFNDKIIKEFVGQNLELFMTNQNFSSDSTLLFKLKASETLKFYVESILPYFKNKTKFIDQFLKLKVQEMLLHLLESDHERKLQNMLFSIYQGQKADLEFIVNLYYKKPLNLSEIAKLSGRSLSSFKREFLDLFGVSPGLWVKDKKLEHAAFMLKNKLANVEEVADEIGYASVSHFIKCFKQKYGKTPLKLKDKV